MRRLWLIFAQAVTVGVALLFVVSTLKPEWLASRPYNGHPVLTLTAPASTDGEGNPASGPASYAPAARKSMPSVVHIFTSKEVKGGRLPFEDDPLFHRFFNNPSDANGHSQQVSGLGSGVIVSPSGYVLTNNHVIEAADEIQVALNDGRKFLAHQVGRDPETDLAILRIDAKKGDTFPAITFADTGSLHIGDVVLAIGNPFGVGQTVTMGIVSALGRSHLGINTFEDFIQTDAAINPGNSGGALVDANGNLVGINTAIYSRTGGSLGIGFAIPVSLARSVMEQIIQTGQVTRGWVGVEIQEVTTDAPTPFELASSKGTLIAGVIRGGPADRAGIRPGDVLLSVNGEATDDPQKMLEVVAALTPGSRATFSLQRSHKPVSLQVEIGRRPPPVAVDSSSRH